MLSKCANPECSEVFRYLHRGKIFRLAPSPSLPATVAQASRLTERFWLCDRCAQEMTVVWDGIQAKVAPLPKKIDIPAILPPPAPSKSPQRAEHLSGRRLAASAGREDC